MNNFFNELNERGLVAQTTDKENIIKQLNEGITLYCGFDPTADSLHVGSLLPLITLLRFKRAGHTVLPLIGGSTGMIGDPSFKAQERSLNSIETVNIFKSGIITQIKELLGNDVEVVDNNDWTENLSVLDFLRDIGKHFSINSMIAKDSVKSRIERKDQGISFTEFSYQLLQSMDFWHLFKNKDCSLQLGGSDQWGNITSGIDLIHKKEGNDIIVSGITMPLLVKSDGTKFGKSESGAVWLCPKKTSPFNFFQFWLQVSDEDIKKFFKMLSFKSIEEIDIILADDEKRDKPIAQQLLAEELTKLIHGENALKSVLRIQEALFKNDFDELTEIDFQLLSQDGIPFSITSINNVVELLTLTGLAKSKKMAREFISNGAVLENGIKITNENDINDLVVKNFKHEKYLILQKGKKNFHLIIKE